MAISDIINSLKNTVTGMLGESQVVENSIESSIELHPFLLVIW